MRKRLWFSGNVKVRADRQFYAVDVYAEADYYSDKGNYDGCPPCEDMEITELKVYSIRGENGEQCELTEGIEEALTSVVKEVPTEEWGIF
ncbi:MAG: hypothetical protein IKP60_13850 [Treponema sp.]|nr:hypothetical protein [Treponema sp.]